MTPLTMLCKWWEQINYPFHVLTQCPHTGFPVSMLFLSLVASSAMAFQHHAYQDLTRSYESVPRGDTAVEEMGETPGKGGFIVPLPEGCAAELVTSVTGQKKKFPGSWQVNCT